MHSHLVRNFDTKFSERRMIPQINPIFLLSLLVFLYSAAFCQGTNMGNLPASSTPPEDSLSGLFEDIYGRFPNEMTAALNYVHSELNSATLYPEPALNDAIADFTAGNRKSYEVSASFQDNTNNTSYPSESLNLGLSVRPNDSWQLSGIANYGHSTGNLSNGQMSLDLSANHLSGGDIHFTENSLRQYYYFSNLFLGSNQSQFGFVPQLADQLNSPSGSKYYTIILPVSLRYGITDRFTGGLAAYYYRSLNQSPAIPSEGIGPSSINGWEYQLGLDLSYLADENNSVEFGLNLYDNSYALEGSSSFSNGYFEQSSTVDKRTFAELSGSWFLSFLNSPISIYDLRRSYYTGNYLNTGEATNQLKVMYSTRDRIENTFLPTSFSDLKTTIADSVVFGLNNIIELSMEGELGQGYSNAISGKGWARYGIAQLTLHNLRFDAPELSDFDYFFGKIDNPGDYSLTIIGSLASDNAINFNTQIPNNGVDLVGRIGIIDGFDAGLNYSYSKSSGTAVSSSYWGFTLRGNLMRAFRVQASTTWGNLQNYFGLPIKTRSLSLQATINALF